MSFLNGRTEIIVSANSSHFVFPDSDDLIDSETGEIVYSKTRSIFGNTYADANRIQAIQKSISALGASLKIKTPPPPSPEFLPNAYYRLPPEDHSKYSDFEDYIQKNHKKYNF